MALKCAFLFTIKVAFYKHMQQLAPQLSNFTPQQTWVSTRLRYYIQTSGVKDGYQRSPWKDTKSSVICPWFTIYPGLVSKNGRATWHGHRLCCRCPCSRISYLHPLSPWIAWQSGWPKLCAQVTQLHTHCQQLYPVCRKETGQEAGTISFHRQPEFLWHFILISVSIIQMETK